MSNYSCFLAFYLPRRIEAGNGEDDKIRTHTPSSSWHEDGFSRVSISYMSNGIDIKFTLFS